MAGVGERWARSVPRTRSGPVHPGLPVFLPVTYLHRVWVKAAAELQVQYNTPFMCILVFISLPSFCQRLLAAVDHMSELQVPAVLPGWIRTSETQQQQQHHVLLFYLQTVKSTAVCSYLFLKTEEAFFNKTT